MLSQWMMTTVAAGGWGGGITEAGHRPVKEGSSLGSSPISSPQLRPLILSSAQLSSLSCWAEIMQNYSVKILQQEGYHEQSRLAAGKLWL